MINPISWIKYRLSHIDQDSWHFHAAKEIWGDKTMGKACTYYWYKLPLALVAFSALAILVVMLAITGAFFGRLVTFGKDGVGDDPFYPYKTLPNGKKFPVAPWEVAVVAVIVFALYTAGFSPVLAVAKILLIAIAVVCLVVAAVFVISKGWHNPLIQGPRQAIVYAWNKACPDLVLEDRSHGVVEEVPQTTE